MKTPLLFAFDLESVLIPELWLAVADKYNVPELQQTTRDGLNVDALYAQRIEICRRRSIPVSQLTQVAAELTLFPGAETVLKWCQSQGQVVVLTDALQELMAPAYRLIPGVEIWGHQALIDDQGFFAGWRSAYLGGKVSVIRQAQENHQRVFAVGDSENDLAMLQAADHAFLFDSSYSLPGVCNVATHGELLAELKKTADSLSESP